MEAEDDVGRINHAGPKQCVIEQVDVKANEAHFQAKSKRVVQRANVLFDGHQLPSYKQFNHRFNYRVCHLECGCLMQTIKLHSNKFHLSHPCGLSLLIRFSALFWQAKLASAWRNTNEYGGGLLSTLNLEMVRHSHCLLGKMRTMGTMEKIRKVQNKNLNNPLLRRYQHLPMIYSSTKQLQREVQTMTKIYLTLKTFWAASVELKLLHHRQIQGTVTISSPSINNQSSTRPSKIAKADQTSGNKVILVTDEDEDKLEKKNDPKGVLFADPCNNDSEPSLKKDLKGKPKNKLRPASNVSLRFSKRL